MTEALGLKKFPEFISLEEEREIVSFIQEQMEFVPKTSKNKVLNYGTKRRSFDLIVKPIPPCIDKIGLRIFNQGLTASHPDSLSVIEMLPGNSICRHVNSVENGKVITVLNMNTVANMRFQKDQVLRGDLADRRPVAEDTPFTEEMIVQIEPRTVTQMSGEIRTFWSHSILPVENKRYSIVYRCLPSRILYL